MHCSRALRRSGLFAFLWGLAVAGSALAVDPQLGAITPPGLQRGTETEVVLAGARLADVKEILFYTPGVSVKSLEAADASVKAKLAVAPDCRLGIHAIRLRAASGVSNLRTFTVGNLPMLAEVEPNTLFTEPQVVSLGVAITGVVQNEDVDYYAVELKKGQRLNAEVEGLRLGNTNFDPYVAILNADRFELARSDDSPLLFQDCICSIVAPEDGRYIVQVRESAYGGNGACTYRLYLGSFPRPTAVYPAGGKPGEKLTVKWIGDAAGDFSSEVTLPPATEAYPGLVARDAQGEAPSPNPVRIIDLANSLEVEPNETFAQASPSGVAPLALNGIIEKPGDIDYFKFKALKGQQLEVRVYARKPLRSPLDSLITVTNDKGATVTSNDDSGGPDSYVRLNVAADAEYGLAIRDHLGAGGANYVYRVEITPVEPSLTLNLPEKVQYIPTVLNVARGNRMALMVGAQRTNFGGDLNLSAERLPPGMTIETMPMTAALTQVPVVFSAAADAAPAGSLADLIGKAADPAVKVVGHLRQRTMLIRGNNNNDVWGHDADHMAVVLTEDLPFKIDLVQPKAPLVKGGSISLKVVATRAPDYKAPIGVRLLYNPNGVGSSASVVIPEGQTEALIPLTANATAGVGSWKVCVLGSAPVGNGRVETSTQLVDLNIAEPFFKFTFEKAAVEQGQATEVAINIEKLTDFPGEATVELGGLPSGAATEPTKFTSGAEEILFKVNCVKEARPGRYTTLVAVAKFTLDGEVVTHTIPGGELRIDAPLPPKVEPAKTAAKPAATPAPMPAAAKPMEKKRLSRLEQLRLEREQNGTK